jgi:cytochrome b involved in lipid metabolism
METKKPTINRGFLVLGFIVILALVGALFLVPKNSNVDDRNPLNPNTGTKCGIQECHGLNLTCGSNVPDACTAEFVSGDVCREGFSCQIINGNCQTKTTTEYVSCKSCVEKCETTYKSEPDRVMDCASDCLKATNVPNSYIMAEVKAHADEGSCWTVLRGNVYDVTPAIETHKGGRDKIIAMCGTDATAAFETKHGGQEKPEAWLKTLEIGVLAK